MKNFSLILVLILTVTSCSKYPELYKQRPAFYSYVFGNVKNSNIKSNYNSEIYITPASCQKVVTSLLAYKKLGVDFRYQTKLFKKNNDLIIQFSGDPTLDSEGLAELLKSAENKTYNKIILDISKFQTPQHSPNILIGDIGSKYSSPVSAMNIDQNQILVTVKPKKLGKKAQISNDNGYKIISEILTTEEESKIETSWEGNKIKVEGNIKINTKPLQLQITPPKIEEYALRKIKNILKATKINAEIVIIADGNKLPKNSKLLNTIESEPLNSILPIALKKSNNLVFDALYLQIITSQKPEIIKWNQGSDIIKSLVKEEFDVDLKNSIIVDGSGMSRYNKIQTKMIFDLMKKGYEIKEFVTSLPAPNEVNSTLEKRRKLPIDVRAKTGNMLGITCLCGYKVDEKNPKVFIVTAHDFTAPVAPIFLAIDEFVDKNLNNILSW